MFKNLFKRGRSDKQPEKKSMNEMIEQFKKSSDFMTLAIGAQHKKFAITYFKQLINVNSVEQKIILPLQKLDFVLNDLNDIENVMPIEDISITTDTQIIEEKLLRGYVMFQLHTDDKKVALLKVESLDTGFRKENDSENEFSVVGPKVGLVEDLDVNLYLMRKTLISNRLIFKELSIGTVSKTRVIIAYIEGVTNPQHVETLTQRIEEVDFDVIFDSTMLDQLISDHSASPFPLFLTTERIDRVVFALLNGQVAFFTSGSPYAVTGPSTLLDFFISPEDYYLPWVLGSFFRLIRMFGVFFSIFATPLYVAIVTYHYEMLPKDLLGPIIFSRTNVPFPPVVEVLFLEITIELLREAGARLPTKVGQTLGIVGGIVIGQATVEASLTSNILLIIVSLTALASFTTPIFKMSNTIRLLRFPFIIFASLLGLPGITLCFCLLLVHLMRLESLGTPYLVPLYPFRPNGYRDSFLRLPYSHTAKRPSFLRPLKRLRYDEQKAKKKKDPGINEE
ncbi:spore germination protein [Bacillus sp. CGMCC 1.16541]|uniref:spore germination protein n=1 Tax=Bacillus sp. CGMCC 1.16541 TaxID=2185143 RepID=UPI000D736CE5|nr:spore germination protein [Bacillus sp. CGMCC 1.16541]